MNDPRKFLQELFKAGLVAADPLKILPPHLPAPPKGRTVVIGAGKAAAAMAGAVEAHWKGALSGVVVTRRGYGMKTEKIEVIEAAHPVPDETSEAAARKILKAVEGLSADDLVLCLISGGGSALLCLPAPCLSIAEKQGINRALLKSGATIHEINCVRKHLSAIKGGRLALAARPARIVTLIISDVPGDDAATVASGPTLPDPTTAGEALAVLEKYKIPVSDKMRAWLSDPANETPKPGDARFKNAETKIIARNMDVLMAAAGYAAAQGVEPILLGDGIEGVAREVGDEHVRQAFHCLKKSPCVLLSGGETTVTVHGNGRGGRNSEYLLAAAIAAMGKPQIYGLACGTDGIDGTEDNAGAIFTPNSIIEAKKKDMDPDACLENNDAWGFFDACGGLVVTGPTFTNVGDFRAILVL